MRIWAAFRRAFGRRRRGDHNGDWCAVCLVDLRDGSTWEERSDEKIHRDGHGGLIGGTFLSRTFCAEHATPSARRR